MSAHPSTAHPSTAGLPFDASLLENAPEAIRLLPRDPRGYPIPWFVATLADGTRDLRVACGVKRWRGYHRDLCWVCGEPLARIRCFIGGPFSVVNRVFQDWAMHPGCAEFSVRACPFLNGRMARRNHVNFPEGTVASDGHIDDAAEATAIYFTKGCQVSSNLFLASAPVRVVWYRGGELLPAGEEVPILERARELIMAELKNLR